MSPPCVTHRGLFYSFSFPKPFIFYAQEYHFADISKKVYLYGGCMNRKI